MAKKKEWTAGVLFELHSRGMFNICLRMTGNRQDAEDVMQEAFYRAYTRLDSLRSMDSFGPWLRRIVVNQCISFLRSKIYFDEVDLANVKAQDTDGEYLEEIPMATINREIAGLPDGCRIVFNLYLLENYTHREIAEKLGCSESTSKSQYQRARRLLQERLNAYIEV